MFRCGQLAPGLFVQQDAVGLASKQGYSTASIKEEKAKVRENSALMWTDHLCLYPVIEYRAKKVISMEVKLNLK